MSEKTYNLEVRTTEFARSVIVLCRGLDQNLVSRPIVSQLLRSATSIGANYMEANGAESRKDFLHKASLCKKEARETKYWLELIPECFPSRSPELQALSEEYGELIKIFGAITRKTPNQSEKLKT